MKSKSKISNLVLMFMIFFGALGFIPETVIAIPGGIKAGDVAVILMNKGNPDAIAFVALAYLPEGETIIFTDSGWLAAGGFKAGEGAIRYTVPSGGLPAGSIVYRESHFDSEGWDEPTGLGFTDVFQLNTPGDQVIVFQGDATTHSLIYAVNNEGLAVWQSDATNSLTSALPTGLIEGETAVAVNEKDYIRLNCVENHIGTKEDLLFYISNSANWVGDDSSRQSVDPSCSFTVTGCAPQEPKINEFVADHDGTDQYEFVEIYGDPNTNYSDYTILQIEGDSSGAGTIDSVLPVGTTDAFGFWWTDFISGLENGTITLLLVKDFTGSMGDVLDTDNDGVFDTTIPWSEITDSVATSDGDGSDWTYGAPDLPPNYDGNTYQPGGASRIPDGYDTETDTDWVRNGFDFLNPAYFGDAHNTPGGPNDVQSCGDPYTPIYDIQGNGSETPIPPDTEVVTEGVVVGDFQEGGKDGFFIQDATGDEDLATSDGIFVYYTGVDVEVGDHVRLQGEPSEYYDLSQIGYIEWLEVCAVGEPLPAPVVLTLPVASRDDFEPFEGMRVTFSQDLVISEYFNFDWLNEVVLTSQRYLNFTAISEPDGAGFAASNAEYALNSITLDDGRTSYNPDPAIHPNGLEFNLSNRFRGGDLLTNVTGVMDYGFGLYRIQPTEGADYTPTNPRTPAPDIIEGDIKVASLNVYNYFTTIDDSGAICGPAGDQGCRGADSVEELERQRAKIIDALLTIDADIVGLMEIENDRPGPAPDYAVADLVAGLNDMAGSVIYDYIATGAIGTDAIKVAMIYKPGNVTPVGDYAILDSTVDPLFLDDYNRPVLAQTFMDKIVGEKVTVAVNHLKSKSGPYSGDPDPTNPFDFDSDDGAGWWNATRTSAAEAMVDWLATDPTGSVSDHFLIIGDLNSYDKEDPIDAIKAGADGVPGTDDDYFDMIYEILGEDAYSYLYDGRTGYLDYAMANRTLAEFVADVTIWHINADEVDLINYDTSYKKDAQDAIYAPDAYRASDHDPVIITLTFNKPPEAEDDYYETNQDETLIVPADGVLGNDVELNENDVITLDVVVEPLHGSVELNNDGSFTYIPDPLYYGEDSFEYLMMAYPPERDAFSDTATVYITIHPNYKIYFPAVYYGD